MMDTTTDYSEDEDELSAAVRQFLSDEEPLPSFVETARDLREWVAELYGLEDEIDTESDVD